MKVFWKSILFIGLSILILSNILVAPPPEADPIEPYLNNVFPKTSLNDWELVKPFEDLSIAMPVRITQFHDNRLLILSKLGKVYLFDTETQEERLLLDISDKTVPKGDAGALGIALHPKFGSSNHPDKQLLFIFYRAHPNPDKNENIGYKRLSKFSWNNQSKTFDEDSEEILINQLDRMPLHDGMSMFFGRDGFLYFACGDEGFFEPEKQKKVTQNINLGFYSGIFRIDVDNDPTRSHPIRRQPQTLAETPDGWKSTFSQGYFIPDDNPFINEEGENLEEYFALGIRSPFTMQQDPQNDEIWLADVGSHLREEINYVEKGDNLQWPYMEGYQSTSNHSKPDEIIGNEKIPYFIYKREVGTAIIGGGKYTSQRYPELTGKYIFGDYTQNKIMIVNEEDSSEKTLKTLLKGIDIEKFGVSDQIFLTGFFFTDNGRIFIHAMNNGNKNIGEILELIPTSNNIDPPGKLSEVGAFKDLSTMEAVDGLLPYEVNTPLWSDNAIKKRWIALPNDGNPDSDEEQIAFKPNDSWRFPPGTVFIKHFELPTDASDPSKTTRLETRFIVVKKDGGVYGITYKWNEEGTEAYLLDKDVSREIAVKDETGMTRLQRWDFPTRKQCLDCHNRSAGQALGFKVNQLNKEKYYPDMAESMNQLTYFSNLDFFDTSIPDPSFLLKSSSLDDEEASLQSRVLSYLDANCSSCHTSGHLIETDLDLRLQATLNVSSLLNKEVLSHASNQMHKIVTPGNHATSELWVRDASSESNKMPPLGRNIVDQQYVDMLAEWIDGMDSTAVDNSVSLKIFPNPTRDYITISLDQKVDGPFTYRILDMQGSVVREFDKSNHTLSFNAQNLQSGKYFVVVSNNTQRFRSSFVRL